MQKPVTFPKRVRDASIFKVTGVDFAGPLYLRSGEKAWVSIYLCSIYIELVTSSNYFIQPSRRFVSRRAGQTLFKMIIIDRNLLVSKIV